MKKERQVKGMTDNTEISRNLKKRFIPEKKSSIKKEFAVYVGMRTATVYQILNGKQYLNAYTFFNACCFLNLKPSCIISDFQNTPICSERPNYVFDNSDVKKAWKAIRKNKLPDYNLLHIKQQKLSFMFSQSLEYINRRDSEKKKTIISFYDIDMLCEIYGINIDDVLYYMINGARI